MVLSQANAVPFSAYDIITAAKLAQYIDFIDTDHLWESRAC
jgi:hypothetical protein